MVHQVCLTNWIASIVFTAVGYALAESLPPLVRVGLVFVGPLYFLLILTGRRAIATEWSHWPAGRSSARWCIWRRRNGASCSEVCSGVRWPGPCFAGRSVLELALLVLACSLGTYLWRGLGMLVAGKVSMGSEFFVWAGCRPTR